MYASAWTEESINHLLLSPFTPESVWNNQVKLIYSEFASVKPR